MQLQVRRFERDGAERMPEGNADGSHLAGMPPMRVIVHDRMEPLEAAWRHLSAENTVSLHQGYDWCQAWARTQADDLLILEGASGQETQFLLPLAIERRGPLRIARLLATDFSNINTGLYSVALRTPEASAALRKALGQSRGELSRFFDLLLLEKVPLTWRGETSPFAGLPATRNQNATFQLQLFEDFEHTLAQLNAKRRRKKFRSSERRLMALGGYEHIVAGSADEARPLLELFFRQKAARFKAMGMRDVFHDEPVRNFFRALAAIPPAGGDYPLQLHAVRLKGAHDGEIVAITGLSRKGDHVICQFGSIDETIAPDASPGEFLFHLAIQKLCGEGARLFDFGLGDQAYKRSWCRIETPQHDLLLATTMAGRVAAAAHRATTMAKRLIKSNPQVYSLLQRLRAARAETARAEDAD